jgi:diguanylate cyclase (GGDEF)-like protein
VAAASATRVRTWLARAAGLPADFGPPARQLEAARVGGILVAVAGTVSLVAALAPPLSPWPMVLASAAELTAGLVISLVLPARLSPGVLLAGVYVLLAGLVLAYVESGRLESTRVTFFVWMIPYVAYYFGRAATVRIAAVTATALAVAVAVLADSPWAAALAWLSTMVAVGTVAVFVLWATARMRESEASARSAAHHDPLTGLANRQLWATEVERALTDLGELGGQLVVILVDLDDFKGVNDTFGHPAGDALLAQVAPRLASVMRTQDTVARLGGDEFALLAHDRTGDLDADVLAARVLAVLATPTTLPGGEQAYPLASIGVVVATRPRPAADLLREADVAMYEAKAAGRNRAARFGPQMAARVAERQGLLTALRAALARGQCTVAYQPAYDLTTMAPVGAEALLRWDHPELGVIPPATFAPMAEAAGLTEELTRFVLEEAVRQLAAWREQGRVSADFTVGINLALPDLHPGLAATVLASAAAHGVPPSNLIVEVTEAALVAAPAGTEQLEALRAAGVRLFLDGFGAGSSSLAHVERLPLDGIKLDPAFLPEGDDPRRWALVRAILDVAHALGLTMVAEGVETAAQAEMLHTLGLERAQGLLMAGPGGPDDLVAVGAAVPAFATPPRASA